MSTKKRDVATRISQLDEGTQRAKPVLHQHAREFVLHLARFHLVVELGNLGQRVGGDQPDFTRGGIGYSDEI